METLQLCKEHRGYTTPDLNDRLYLHSQNFARIEGLEEFVNVKALWLQSNALTKIEGISHMLNLKVLHLHSNRCPHEMHRQKETPCASPLEPHTITFPPH